MLALATPPYADITEESIAVLIDHFYAAVRGDPVLAPVFEATIAEAEWPQHLATIHRFWSSVMLASGRYSGNPVAVHRLVGNLDRPMFARWLALFEATAAELFAAEPAARFVIKAHRIADSLQLALFHKLRAPPEGLPARRPLSASVSLRSPGDDHLDDRGHAIKPEVGP